MKKDFLLKAAALGAALITCLSGFTSRPVTQNKLPDVLNPLAKTMAEVADGISKAKTISFGKFGGYTDQTTLLNPDSAGSFGSLTVKETTRSNLEKTELSFSKASGVMTLFDFTLAASEKHTITIESDLSGKAKIILTKDNKTITPVWESTNGKQATKTLTLEKGRYRVRLVVSEASGTIAVSVDEPKSLFSHTVEKAEKAYDKILDPALEEYEQALEKAYDRYDRSIDSASDLYGDAMDKAADDYNEKLDQIGEFEYYTYLSAEDGEEMDKEYQKRYSKVDNAYEDAVSDADQDYDELIEQAEGYLEERISKAEEALEKAEKQAQKAWDAVIG